MKNKKIISIILLICMITTIFNVPVSACTDKAGASYFSCAGGHSCYRVICFTHNIQYSEIHSNGCGCVNGHTISRCGICGVKVCCGESHNACTHGTCSHTCKTHHENHCDVCHSTEHIHGYPCDPCNHSCTTHHENHCLTCHSEPCSCFPSASTITIQDVFYSISVTVRATNDNASSHRLYDENNNLITEIEGASCEFTITENGTYYVTPVNQSGENPNYQQVFINKIDRESPVVNSTDVSTSWSNTTIPVTVSAIDNLSGVGEYGYSNNGGNIYWQTESILNIPDNGDFRAYAKDIVGNVSEQYAFTVSHIDKEFPSANYTITPELFTQDKVNINVTATDTQSGVKNIVNPQGKNANDYIVTENGEYTFTVFDEAGNKLEYTVTISNIDTAAPEYSFELNTQEFTNKDVIINVSATDSQSGVSKIILPDNTEVNGDTASYAVTKNGEYTFAFYDNVNNSSQLTVKVEKIDRTKPIGSHTLSITEFTQESVDVFLETSDELSGIEKIILPDNSEVAKNTAQFTVEANGDYTFFIYDVAGNVTEYIVSVKNIDTQAPTLSHTLSTENWTNQDVVISLIATDNLSGVAKVVFPNGNEITDFSKDDIAYTATANDNYAFSVYDNVGNLFIKDIEIDNIDKVNPTAVLNKSTDNWISGGVDITLQSSDDLSQVKSVTLPNGVVVDKSDVLFKAENNGEYNFKVTDNAGNNENFKITVDNVETQIPTPPYISDITDKELLEKATFDKDDYLVFPWTNKDVTLTISSNAQSGISKIEYSLNNKEWTPLTEKSLTFSTEGIHSLILRSISNAGNVSQATKYVIKIDKTLPTQELVQLKNKTTLYAKDTLSGVMNITCDCAVTEKDYITCKFEVGEHKHKFVITDTAGNSCEYFADITVTEELTITEELITNSQDNNKSGKNILKYILLPLVAFVIGFVSWFLILFFKKKKDEDEDEIDK